MSAVVRVLGGGAVFLITFAAFFDTHAQMPIIGDFARSLGARPLGVGITVGIYSFTNILGNGASGLLIDARGWQLPLFMGLGAAAVLLYAYSWAQTLAVLLLVRAMHGLAGGLLVPAALAAARAIGAGRIEQSLGLFGSAIGFAALTGPPLAGMVAGRWGYAATYQALAGLMLLVFCAGMNLLRAQLRSQAARPTKQQESSPVPLAVTAFASLGAFLLMGGTGTVIGFLPVKAAEVGFSAARTGQLFGAFALAAIAVQLVWSQSALLYSRSRERSTLLGLLLLHLALCLFPLQQSAVGLFATAVLFGCGFGLAFPNMLKMVVTGGIRRGRRMGLFFASYSLGVALVPPLAGFVVQQLPQVSPFFVAVAVGLLGLGLLASLQLREALARA